MTVPSDDLIIEQPTLGTRTLIRELVNALEAARAFVQEDWCRELVDKAIVRGRSNL